MPRSIPQAVYTRRSVWLGWLNYPLNEKGILLRIKRLARRRGKSNTWISKRFHQDVYRHKHYQADQAARLREIYEGMQQMMLQGEHEHEHGEAGPTGTDPGTEPTTTE